ncbi:hypothetical protein [Symbiopectobacterium sp. RP]|uniref:hypothetical protein n=1 Tax=Symbiopectobacterium sp. RP TaxID=3248553 RepID=UPI003D2DD6BB
MGTSKKQKKREWLRYRDFVLSPYGVIKIKSFSYISFSQLNEPIISLALRQVAPSPHPYALVVHDWSHLQFRTHNGKEERLKMMHGGDVGYELQTSLLVDAANGLPIAPLSQTLTDRAGCRSTLSEGLSESLTHMDALTADIARVESLDIANRLKNDYSQCPDMWQKNTANCYQNNVALL